MTLAQPPDPFAATVRKLQSLCERAAIIGPASGPGWSVAFQDAAGETLTHFRLRSYPQVELLAVEVAALGYELQARDGRPGEFDFVFQERSRAASAGPRHLPLRPEKPDIPGQRLGVGKGDLVMEDCGGPVMLVHTLTADLAYCMWLSEEAAVRSGTFRVDRLVNVSGAKQLLEDASARQAAASRSA